MGGKLPPKRSEYVIIAKALFPNYYDIKSMMQSDDVLELIYKQEMKKVSEKANLAYMGLTRLADVLRLDRIGPQHQAGSDSLLTLKVFF